MSMWKIVSKKTSIFSNLNYINIDGNIYKVFLAQKLLHVKRYFRTYRLSESDKNQVGYIYYELFRNCCSSGNVILIYLLTLKNGISFWETGLFRICEDRRLHPEQQMRLVKLMIAKGADNFHYAMWKACAGGNLELVKMMHEKIVKREKRKQKNSKYLYHLNKGLEFASKSGNLHIMKFLIENGADMFNGALLTVCCFWNNYSKEESINRLEIVKYLFSLNRTGLDLNQAMVNVCASGDIEILKFLIEKDATKVERGLSMEHGLFSACRAFPNRKEHFEIVKYLVETYPDLVISDCFSDVCYGGNLELIEYMLSKGVSISPSRRYILSPRYMQQYVIDFLASKNIR